MVKGRDIAIVVGAGLAAAGIVYAVQAVSPPGGGGGGGGPPPGEFAVQVVDSATLKPIAGAKVTYNATTLTTDATGIVDFKPTTGFTPIDITATGYQEVLEPNFQGVAGETYQIQMINLGAGAATATVVVKDAATLQPIAGATVTIDSQSGTTDSSGSVSFSGLTIGTQYTITASKAGYTSSTQKLTLDASGETFTLVIAGGVAYGESWTGYEFVIAADGSSASAWWQNQNSIAITGRMWVVVKNAAGQTVAIGESLAETLQPLQNQQLIVNPLSGGLAAGTYQVEYFCVDLNNAPISKVFTFPATLT